MDGGSRLSLGNHAVIIYAATTALPRIPKYLRVLGCRKRIADARGGRTYRREQTHPRGYALKTSILRGARGTSTAQNQRIC